MDTIVTTILTVKWSTSRGRDTYGYNIVSIRDENTGKRYRAMGGGYDMTGTAFGEWLAYVYQDRLTAISDRAYQTATPTGDGGPWTRTTNDGGLYGMTFYPHVPGIALDGACGLSSMERIAEAIGLTVRHITNRKGHTTMFVIEDTRAE